MLQFPSASATAHSSAHFRALIHTNAHTAHGVRNGDIITFTHICQWPLVHNKFTFTLNYICSQIKVAPANDAQVSSHNMSKNTIQTLKLSHVTWSLLPLVPGLAGNAPSDTKSSMFPYVLLSSKTPRPFSHSLDTLKHTKINEEEDIK